MNFLPVDAIVLFVGGPNNGFIETGDNATLFTLDVELPKEGETEPGDVFPLAGERFKVGSRMKMAPRYYMDTIQRISREKAFALWGKHGVGSPSFSVYELTEIDTSGSDGDVFVYKYIGDQSEVFPEEK
jgi:hypothetical protein